MRHKNWEQQAARIHRKQLYLTVAGPRLTGDGQAARGTLAKLYLRGNMVTDIPLAWLSPWQRVRATLVGAFLTSPQLLILDEVTTHLDADTIDTFIGALNSWQGARLVNAHDRHFMRCLVGRGTQQEQAMMRTTAEGMTPRRTLCREQYPTFSRLEYESWKEGCSNTNRPLPKWWTS
ncbi:hypothetical protein G647_00706 [Cladophialophora carrionii CBS 160.54]|uniref:ABC transporter domain-containing protein n=1 Tax=Cladophialophora carrionii CBS 160.54 TaxID=1279043 RepID=V9DQM4_9EURO|nr:uncharacterized protein G647_00706 [Cladophialophora carrionii CBS 160.54]ETI28257.1 hypothetical protein G647_00706 [Cladophialophora carrionii CBS 160.54]